MVDFKKLQEKKGKPKPINPRDIFNALPKPPGINDLYASQAEELDAWFIRRTDRDIVVKLHTGGGKTLVALLMAQSVMNELGEPVIYLAPTNQLVDQVISKDREYGIPTVRYVKKQPLANEFFDGKAVLVGAYETLFNGFSKFGVRNSGKSIVKAGALTATAYNLLQSPSCLQTDRRPDSVRNTQNSSKMAQRRLFKTAKADQIHSRIPPGTAKFSVLSSLLD